LPTFTKFCSKLSSLCLHHKTGTKHINLGNFKFIFFYYMNASNVETLVPMTCNHILQLFGCKPLGLGFFFSILWYQKIGWINQIYIKNQFPKALKFWFKTKKNQKKNTIVETKKKTSIGIFQFTFFYLVKYN
jgi:hypothetical protein